jgi:hypothetical protein
LMALMAAPFVLPAQAGGAFVDGTVAVAGPASAATIATLASSAAAARAVRGMVSPSR